MCLGRGSRKTALVAEILDVDAPEHIALACAVGGPAVVAVEAIGAGVAHEQPEKRVMKSLTRQVIAGIGDESYAETAAPSIRIDVKSAELPVARKRGIAGRHGGRKAAEDATGGSYPGMGLGSIAVREIVAGGAVLRAEGCEVVAGEKMAIGDLPRAHMDFRDSERIGGNGGTNLDG